MKEFGLNVGLLCGVFLFAPLASAASITVDFDHVRDSGFQVGNFIQDGYSDFVWSNFGVIEPVSLGEPFETSGYTNGIVSGDSVGFIDSGSTVTRGGDLFDFSSAYLTSAWRDNVYVLVTGYLNNNASYQDIFYIDSYVPAFIDFEYLGIDRLTFSSANGIDAGYGGNGSNVAIDDMVFNISSVPEPSALILIISGLIGFLGFKRKRII